MNHQPYETWILDDYPVTEKQKSELDYHLKECPDCSELSESWVKTGRTLKSPVIVSAPVYFVRSWKANLALRKYELERKQKRNLTLLVGAGAVVVLFGLAALFLPGISIISISVGLISSLVHLLNTLENVISIIVRSVQQIPAPTLVIISLILSSWFLFASVAWGVSIWKLATQRKQIS